MFDKWILLHPEYAPEEGKIQDLNKRELAKLLKEELPPSNNLEFTILKDFSSFKPSSVIIPKMFRYQQQTRSRKSRLMRARQQKAKEKREQTKRELHYTAHLQESWLDKLKFFKKDAALVKSFELDQESKEKQFYTHVYSYNKVMSEHDLCEICKALNQTKYRVLSWYWGPKATRRFGLRNFIYLHKMTMQSTGGQKFTAFIYLRSNQNEEQQDSSEEEQEGEKQPPEEEEIDDYSDNFDLND